MLGVVSILLGIKVLLTGEFRELQLHNERYIVSIAALLLGIYSLYGFIKKHYKKNE